MTPSWADLLTNCCPALAFGLSPMRKLWWHRYTSRVLVTIQPSDLRRAERIIAKVGEGEFRRAVHEMTGFDTEALSLDDVICAYVLALEGRVQPPGAGRRAVELYPTLPPATEDDPCVELTVRRPSQLL